MKKEEIKNIIIAEFKGEYDFLSNFYSPAPTKFGSRIYPTSEHAYQAAKTLAEPQRKWIAEASTPREAKQRGRQSIELRFDWEEIKIEVMRQIVWDKFNRNLGLKEKLLKTENAFLIEGNTWGDTTWGIYKGKGKNYLGMILMEVREEIKKKERQEK